MGKIVQFSFAFCFAVIAAAQERQLTARELFYYPVPSTTQAKPAVPPATEKPPAKPDTPVVVAKKQTPKKPAASKKTVPPTEPVQEAREKHVPDAGPALPGGAQVTPASTRPMRPLGLRYSLLKHSGGARYDEVDPDTVFRAGDRIKVSVQSNDGGYLYIVHRGSSGAWRVLFPSAEIEDGNNHIAARRQYDLPPGGRFTFDEQAGEEKLFVILSRRQEPDLEKLIYDVSNGPRKPAQEEKPKATLMASSQIDDSLVGRFRNSVLARDLVFEKVDETSEGPRKEKAVYVVNAANRGEDARLVVDLALKHQ